jgi:hypothetical protein
MVKHIVAILVEHEWGWGHYCDATADSKGWEFGGRGEDKRADEEPYRLEVLLRRTRKMTLLKK